MCITVCGGYLGLDTGCAKFHSLRVVAIQSAGCVMYRVLGV